jgi:uncharacterized membrane protein
MATWMKLLHVVTAFWFIGGLIGRTLTMRMAGQSGDIHAVVLLAKLGERFEKLMVIPGSFAVLGFGLVTAWAQHWPLIGQINWLLVSTLLYLSVIPIIIFVFIPRGKIFGQVLAAAVSQEQVTLQLKNALHDRAVAISHAYEWFTTIAIIFLMVTKPF